MSREDKKGLEFKYFVLRPASKTFGDPYAHASRVAMRAYAKAIKKHNEVLAAELIDWADREETEEYGNPLPHAPI